MKRTCKKFANWFVDLHSEPNPARFHLDPPPSSHSHSISLTFTVSVSPPYLSHDLTCPILRATRERSAKSEILSASKSHRAHDIVSQKHEQYSTKPCGACDTAQSKQFNAGLLQMKDELKMPPCTDGDGPSMRIYPNFREPRHATNVFYFEITGTPKALQCTRGLGRACAKPSLDRRSSYPVRSGVKPQLFFLSLLLERATCHGRQQRLQPHLRMTS